MSLILNIPDDAAKAFRDAWGVGLDQAAFEALVIEGYRSGKFGEATVKHLLKHESRWDTQRWLADRGVHANYTIDDLEADRRTLDRLLPKSA